MYHPYHMPTYIRARTTAAGKRRFDVRYRQGGAGFPVVHAGTFHTLKEATSRRDLVAGWLAAGLNPRVELERIHRPPEGSTVAELAARWLDSRVDLDDSTHDSYRSHQQRIDNHFKGVAANISPADVTDWIRSMIDEGLRPGTVRGYVGQLRQILDHLDTNPARHRTVKLPKNVRLIPEPPDADQVVDLLKAVRPRWRPAILLMEQTGMRVSEAIGMNESDIDRDGCRIRVRPEVAKKDRPRWIPVERWFADIAAPLTNIRRGSISEVMHDKAGLHPHLLRHRRATLWHQQGVVAAELARRLGHSRASMSLDVYSSVRPLTECHPSVLLAVLVEQ